MRYVGILKKKVNWTLVKTVKTPIPGKRYAYNMSFGDAEKLIIENVPDKYKTCDSADPYRWKIKRNPVFSGSFRCSGYASKYMVQDKVKLEEETTGATFLMMPEDSATMLQILIQDHRRYLRGDGFLRLIFCFRKISENVVIRPLDPESDVLA